MNNLAENIGKYVIARASNDKIRKILVVCGYDHISKKYIARNILSAQGYQQLPEAAHVLSKDALVEEINNRMFKLDEELQSVHQMCVIEIELEDAYACSNRSNLLIEVKRLATSYYHTYDLIKTLEDVIDFRSCHGFSVELEKRDLVKARKGLRRLESRLKYHFGERYYLAKEAFVSYLPTSNDFTVKALKLFLYDLMDEQKKFAHIAKIVSGLQ